MINKRRLSYKNPGKASIFNIHKLQEELASVRRLY